VNLGCTVPQHFVSQVVQEKDRDYGVKTIAAIEIFQPRLHCSEVRDTGLQGIGIGLTDRRAGQVQANLCFHMGRQHRCSRGEFSLALAWPKVSPSRDEHSQRKSYLP
jgi:hypothetical protein